ncbi:MAG: hypothetical protein IAE86_09145 [Burkholderiaceae bacterium]|nr:hypothetical protein [Burkholderiaceae bacterium]
MANVQSMPPRLSVGSRRLVLIGAPPLLEGVLALANPGGEKLKLKSGLVQLKDSPWGDPHLPLQLTVSARVAGGLAVQVPVTLTVDPRMPPGNYAGELRFEGDDKPREVRLKVLEHRAVVVAPASFELQGAPGASLTVPAVVANLGNVPFTLPKVALVALGEDSAVTQLFHVAMANKGAQGHVAALDAYAQLVAAAEVDAAKVVIGAGAGEPIAPGESLETSFTFELPARLARHRSYHGSFRIGRASCSVDLEVGAESAIELAAPSRTTGNRTTSRK